ncbi:hypothetical protein, partial [uncultured Maritimibacter sp.]|uniref:hypothetical protein n=1 Tax=uncultured Maritimibacter sp. TaxID=991866 RepID=UPI0030DD4D5A
AKPEAAICASAANAPFVRIADQHGLRTPPKVIAAPRENIMLAPEHVCDPPTRLGNPVIAVVAVDPHHS